MKDFIIIKTLLFEISDTEMYITFISCGGSPLSIFLHMDFAPQYDNLSSPVLKQTLYVSSLRELTSIKDVNYITSLVKT